MHYKTVLRYLLTFLVIPVFVIYLLLRIWVTVSFEQQQAPGDIINIDGFDLHVVCQGKGSPTILFETGFGSDSQQTWSKIATQLAATNRTCYYDRLGHGWSDDVPVGLDTPSKAKLLAALTKHLAKEQGVVLVAHSYGGILARRAISEFAAPAEKLILVDSAHENQHARLKPHLNPIPKGAYYAVLADTVFGYTRIKNLLIGEASDRLSHFYSSRRYADILKTYVDEEGFFTPLEQVNIELNDLPLLVLEHDPDAYPDIERWNKANLIWQALQIELAALSSNSKIILIKGATHNIPGDKPEELIEWIRDFVN